MISGNTLICANVGDSRAIMASLKHKEDVENMPPQDDQFQLVKLAADDKTSDKKWLTTILSIDHKPDRKDEYERIIEWGGRVDTFREPDGESVGPARVWLKDQQVPGLAMSRSVGDYVASTVGVISEPEFLEIEIKEYDKFIVIASDGVWEFISNEDWIKYVIPYWENNDPKGACKKLEQVSVEYWKKEDEVIDDITAIVIFLNITPD